MSEDGSNDPLEAAGRALHQKLLDGDVTAPAAIAELFMPVVVSKLSRRYPNLDDPHLINTAVEDALINYFGRPEQCDPARLGLAGYLYMSSNGDLLNLLEREQKTINHKSLSESVELGDGDTEYGVRVHDERELEDLVLVHVSPIWQRLSALLPDLVDQEIVLLMMEGVRSTSAYASVLGVADRSPREQAQIVKRHKDRIKKKLQRNIERSEVIDHG
jgi:hypothetical protein